METLKWLLNSAAFALAFGAFVGGIAKYDKKGEEVLISRVLFVLSWLLGIAAFVSYPDGASIQDRIIIGTLAAILLASPLLWADYFLSRKPPLAPQTIVSHVVPEGHALIKLEPNIVPKPGKKEAVDVYEGENGVICEGISTNGFKALIVPYRNIAPRISSKVNVIPIGPAIDVSSEMQFRCFETSTTISVHPAVWLNETDTKVKFDVEQERPLVVALFENGEISAPERQVTSAFAQGRTLRKRLMGDLIGISINLPSVRTPASQYILESKNGELYLSEFKDWSLTRLLSYRLQAVQWRNDLYEGTAPVGVEEQIRAWEVKASLLLKRFVSNDAFKEFQACQPHLDNAILGKAPDPPKEKLDPTKPNMAPLFRGLLGTDWSLQGYLKSHEKILEKYEKSLVLRF